LFAYRGEFCYPKDRVFYQAKEAKMLEKQQIIWPAHLSEDSLLDLAVRARTSGEKIAVWQEEQGKLAIFFDGKRGLTLRDYTSQTVTIAPGAYLIIDRYRPSMTGASIAGVVIDAVPFTLSYFFQARWGGSYLKNARDYNKKEARMPLEKFWELHTRMNFAWYHDVPAIKDVVKLFDAYGDIVAREIQGMTVHVPLILNLDELASVQ
jgi:hypothetical protein